MADNFQKKVNIKNVPEQYKHLVEDKDKNGKPDFFEDTPLNIVKKLFNLFTQKDSNLYGHKKVDPTALQIIIFVIVAIFIAISAVQLLPFLFIFMIPSFIKIKREKRPSLLKKIFTTSTKYTQSSISKTTTENPLPNIPTTQNSSTTSPDGIKDALGNIIRIILLIGLIGYCAFLAWNYL